MSPRRGGRRRSRPARTRAAFAAVLIVAAVVLFGALRHHRPTSNPTRAAGTPATPTATPTTAATTVDAARRQLAALEVVDRRPFHPATSAGAAKASGHLQGYGLAWSDDTTAPGSHNGCDTRNDMLAKDLHDVRFRSGSRCVVVSGVLDDPYTGRRIPFERGATSSQAVQIDHVVPLELAWDIGAWRWPQSERDAYANDEDLVLAAVDGPANEAKGADGPGEWMPPDHTDWCNYDARFVAILAHYRLAITEADHRAVTAVLAHCSAGT